MSAYGQLKLGPELLNASRESWLGYYTFAGVTLLALGGGYYWLRHSGLEGPNYCLGLIGILLLGMVAAGICIVCHLMGHLFDLLEELRRGPGTGTTGGPHDGA